MESKSVQAKGAETRAAMRAVMADPVMACHDAQRVAALWQKPLLSDQEIPEVLGLPYASWQLSKKRGDSPKMFEIGRRKFARTIDVRAWLDAKAA